ncbi:hypothetical protein [cf. Phormidesmis sp. LEGE 11477]|uniref:hypothetical protein n=1 Tax=cf. Phormidesmis sp. LEGE 11477 TaxID=1828680 RepID=UPI00187F680F|nr:hypothetical protein [cf. Phormidesmis sp. LEGE 11477]MBE9063869.1 hypothetical protein [cf. Phormidesmis sp. LEGE 11477]
MTALSTAPGNTLHTQHTLQTQDILLICQLASTNPENTLEQIQSWSFEQFFGFVCHLFVTTESADIRQQLADLFPKFGSIAILSLVKIAHYFDLQARNQSRNQSHLDRHFPLEVQTLALQALGNMPVETLAIGLAQAIEADTDGDLQRTIAAFLAKAFYRNEKDILSLLSQYLSKKSWCAIENSLIQALSSPQNEETVPGRHNNIHPLPTRASLTEKLAAKQLTEVA